jgi:NAD(P)-dependent dehydrogenase (short-subunit alcohol dehydrogenase family)
MKVAISRVASKIGGLDIVFANEDTGGLTPLGCADLNVFETIIRTNLTSVFFALQAALPHLRDGGSVVLNSSAHAVVGAPGYSAYAASKAGVRAMTRVLTSELSHRNIRVNVLTPAAATTPIWDRRAPGVASCEALERRIADADEAARSVLFLASDESSLIKAAEIVIGGRPTEYGQSASTADPA